MNSVVVGVNVSLSWWPGSALVTPRVVVSTPAATSRVRPPRAPAVILLEPRPCKQIVSHVKRNAFHCTENYRFMVADVLTCRVMI